MTALHQFVPALSPRDAVGAHTLAVQRVLRAHGVESEIYAAEIHRDLHARAQSFKSFKGGTPILYHCAIGCPMGDWVAARDEPLVLDYHNITPREYFDAWQPETALLLGEGRAQLARLAPKAKLGLADSAFNARELADLGCAPTAVVPVFIDPSEWGAVDPRRRDELGAAKRGADWLFVGRLAPNKCQHDLITAFAMYRRVWDADARLWIVGGSSSDDYVATLERLVAHLGLGSSVTIVGSAPPDELGAYFATADVFVCVSEHEGFCVPVVEAMWWEVPVVAFASTAVTETVADAGIVLPRKDPTTVAAAVARVVSDPELRAQMRAAGKLRADDFAPAKTEKTLLTALADFL